MSKRNTPHRKRIFGKGRFHRYQLTNEVAEYRGEYVRLAVDRKTGRRILWIDEEKS
jgi:hypothetical protein